MNDLWNELWDRLESALTKAGRLVAAGMPWFTFRVGHSSTKTFPFDAFLSFSPQHAPGEEVLVVSIACQRTPSGVVCTSDIARGNGYMLIDGPSTSIDPTHESSSEVARKWLLDVEQFLGDGVDLIVAELRTKCDEDHD